ncbi:TerB N-terminal domain-containing protein [Herbidospora sp. RD11066]
MVSGYQLIGGLLYVGSGLPSASRDGVEPALIDPWLPVDVHRPDWDGATLDYWPSYSSISPQARAAHLGWLADGRRAPGIPIGYVFLYLYGLERRVLHDLSLDRSIVEPELPAIHDEVRRLLGVYGGHDSFRRYAGRFEELLTVLVGTEAGQVPSPLGLRLGLGDRASRGEPVPAAWAHDWILSHPGHHPRTPATRCAEQFRRLFELRYTERFGAGLVVRPGPATFAFEYRPASAGFRGSVTLSLPSVPDVLAAEAPLRKLAELADECASALEPFSRFAGRSPGEEHTLQAQALLPPELLDLTSGEVADLVGWARTRLGSAESVEVPAAEFARGAAKPGKKDVVALARVLDAAGVGIEPDPRLGGPVPTAGSMVLFAAPGGPTAAPSDAYQAATLLLHFAAAVSAADDGVSEAEQRHLSDHLERALHLTGAERTRLRAHLRWLLIAPVKLSGLTRRIAGTDQAQRASLAAFLTEVARADGVISPGEVKTLAKIYRLLDLDETLVAPATAPVVVRPARPEPGFAIPEPPSPAVQLNRDVIARKLVETAQVSALLGAIFTDDDAPAPPPPPPAADPVAGLDGRHSALVRALPATGEISRSRFEELAARWNLLPDGAIDQINEAALDVAGEPLLEGDDPVRVDRTLLGELLT